MIIPDWPAPRRVRSAFTVRTGGVSGAPYDSLNVGAHVGDAPDAVRENRRRVREMLRLPGEPVWLQQVHGVGVLDVGAVEDIRHHSAQMGVVKSQPLGIGASGAEAAARGGAAIGARGEAAAGSRAVAADVATGVATAAGGGGAAGSRDAVARVATGGATAARGEAAARSRDAAGGVATGGATAVRGEAAAGARDVAEISAAAGDPPRADAAVSHASGRVCVIQVADCMPVLFAARDGSAVGAAHAGWRGLAGGVLEATVAKLGVAPSDLLAWLGPTISQENFEVGEDVRTAFTTADPGAVAAFVANTRGRWQCDLYALARRRLAALGVTSVFGGGWCTYADSARFFSFRRDGQCGRMAALIWLE